MSVTQWFDGRSARGPAGSEAWSLLEQFQTVMTFPTGSRPVEVLLTGCCAMSAAALHP
jgi:hypothetical protein